MTSQIGTHGMAGSSMEARPGDPRIAWVDTAKGLCIILVVMMHSTLGLGEAVGREGWLHDVVAFARPFRMPDFFLISGLFLARVIDRKWIDYADKRVVHFLYFYVLWFLIQSTVKIGTIVEGGASGILSHLGLGLVEPFGTLWFVYLLAIFSVTTKLLRRVSPATLLVLAAVLEILPVHTGWILIDEFAERYVYFLAGYLLAPAIFGLANHTVRRPIAAMAGLLLWAAVNGVFAFAPTGHPDFPTWASLPFVSLGLGMVGAAAIVAFSALITHLRIAAPLAYCGRHSIAIYLAFFLPMALTRTIYVKFDLVADVGLVSAIITTVAIVTPLIVERMVRGTPLGFLFERPAFFRIGGGRAPAPTATADEASETASALPDAPRTTDRSGERGGSDSTSEGKPAVA